MSLANNFRLSIFVKARLSIDLKIILKTKSLWDRPVLAGRATLHTVRLRFYLQILRFAHQVFGFLFLPLLPRIFDELQLGQSPFIVHA